MQNRNYPKNPADKNLQIAKEASIYANRIAHKSNSRDLLNKTYRELHYDKNFQILDIQFQQLRQAHKKRVEQKLALSVDEDYKKPPAKYGSHEYCEWAKAWYESAIDVSKRMGIGNCQECAMLAIEYCLNFPGVSVELFSIESKGTGKMKDHAFIVIGRDQSKDPLKIAEWGQDAVICDPWARKYYKATEKEVKSNLQYITEEYDRSREGNYRTLTDFNPEKDKLQLRLSISMLKGPENKDEKKFTS